MRFLATSIGLALALVTAPTVAGDFEDGSAALERGDHSTALSKFKESAAQGDPNAQYRLGLMYRQGLGVTQDDRQAAVWFEKAAAQGNPAAQTDLGAMYGQGVGVTQDDKQAVFWSAKAAAQGIAIAQLNLGNAYSRGRGVKQDDTQALFWYEKAAEQRDASAQARAGLAYYTGAGVPQDYKQAMLWTEKAAAQGHAGAQLDLGALYFHGHGVAQDNVEAHTWWTLAAENGDRSARRNIETVERKMTRAQIAEAQQRVSAPPRWPPAWVLVGGGHSTASFNVYADPATIRRTAGVATMWSLYDYKVKQVSRVTGRPFQSMKGQNEYDCRDAKERGLYYSEHSARLGNGEVVLSTAGVGPSDQWEAVLPRSAGEQLWKIACGKS